MNGRRSKQLRRLANKKAREAGVPQVTMQIYKSLKKDFKNGWRPTAADFAEPKQAAA